MSDDIVDAIAKFRVAFLRENMKAPATIMLESHDEGMRFICHLDQGTRWTYRHDELGKPIEMADGAVYMEIEIMGMKVRWPANRYAMPDGSYKYL